MKIKLLALFIFSVFITQAQKAVKKPAPQVFTNRFMVVPVNINTDQSEFSPFYSSNKLYFVSTLSEKMAVAYTSNSLNTTDIFECTKVDSLSFSKPKSISEINSTMDDGPAMLNSTGNYMVFSASNSKGKLQLYYSTFEAGKWNKPIQHPVSRNSNSYCHPFLTNNGNTLFFCCDKDGGYGGMDIYYSNFENLNWSNPVNLGPKVNSSANEIFPYINVDNQLYFSSKRSGGMGDLDIYSFNINDSLNAVSSLLPAPINSVADDFGICFDGGTSNGYFSSNRNPKEGDNIYYFSKIIPDFNLCLPVKKSSCFTFMKDTYSLSDGATDTEYEWDFGDGNKAKAKAVKHCYSSPGFYTVKLNVIEKSTAKIVYNEMAYTIAVRPQGLAIDIKDTLFINTPLEFDASNSQLEGFTILSYNWIFSDSSFAKGPKTTHTYLKNGIYLVELGVEAQNKLTKQVSKFCIDKKILVGDKEYIEKNLRYFKYAELLPDADSLYYQNEEEDVALNTIKKSKTFRYTNLSADAFKLTGEEDGDVILSEKERMLLTHKFELLGADGKSLDTMEENETTLRSKNRLLRLKNAGLPPIVDTLYIPKENDETTYRVNLGWSDSRVDKNSSVFEGIKKLEETSEGNRYRYTSGNEKTFAAVIPYYENAKQKGFKDAAVVGFLKENIAKGQAKNLHAILFDSASVESQAVKVYFKYNVASYDKKYNQQLDSLVSKSSNKENRKILLITHFDGLGGEAYNLNLNTQRTNNMINYLVAKGIRKSQIKTEFIIHPTEKLEPDLLRRIEVFLIN
ncbi:MAG: PKD domain-containing protein [Bacteroidetes bacterium]|nr:PKD domain-containing protein [Bacteroidota bacterium]